jgi:asparagine synthase (glutamine-hydrolysing)
MPGIVGCITRLPRALAEEMVRRMTESMMHEEFYVGGTWSDESEGVYLGWVARQGSSCERMPLSDERQNVVLTFSGEEFSEEGRKSPSLSYLLDFYAQDGSFPKRLNGRFQGFLCDRRAGRSKLFNDRYGMNRLYYQQSADAFFFSAEAKAILAVRPELRNIDQQSLAEIVACGSVLENRTIFQGIHVLPNGSVWEFSRGELVRKLSYFHPQEWEDQEPLEAEKYYQELRETFDRVLPRYFGGEEQIGMSLTGGLDTRMILACHRAPPGSLPCYTFGSEFRENADVRTARKVAASCGQSFQVLTAGAEFLVRFQEYAQRTVYLTDGIVDVGRSPDLYLNERVRSIAPIRMTGVYGGEVLREVRAFKATEPHAGIYCDDFVDTVREAGRTLEEKLYRHPVSFAAFQQAPWALYGVLALEQSQLTMRSPFLDNDLVRIVFRAPRESTRNNEISLRLIRDGNAELLRIPTDRGLAGGRGKAQSAMVRSLLEFQFRAEYAYDMGMPQWLARVDHLLASFHLERLFLGRHKTFHFRIWYRDVLAGDIQSLLLDENALSRPYVRRQGLAAMVRKHVSGEKNFTNELHRLLTLEFINRCFIDSEIRVNPARKVSSFTLPRQDATFA